MTSNLQEFKQMVRDRVRRGIAIIIGGAYADSDPPAKAKKWIHISDPAWNRNISRKEKGERILQFYFEDNNLLDSEQDAMAGIVFSLAHLCKNEAEFDYVLKLAKWNAGHHSTDRAPWADKS